MLNINREGRVVVLELDRPERRNALSVALIELLDTAIQDCNSDRSVGAIVLTGSAPGFCAGSDVKEFAGMTVEEICRHEAMRGAFARSLSLLSKPVVAAVEGFAVGGGLSLAASCDLVVTSPSCRWRIFGATLGWLPPWGLEPVAARTGPIVARRLTWGLDPIDGQEAVRLGIADFLTEEGQVLARALERARRLANLPEEAVAASKRYFASHVSGAAEYLDAEANEMFASNCRHEAARLTLARYTVKV